MVTVAVTRVVPNWQLLVNRVSSGSARSPLFQVGKQAGQRLLLRPLLLEAAALATVTFQVRMLWQQRRREAGQAAVARVNRPLACWTSERCRSLSCRSWKTTGSSTCCTLVTSRS